MKKMSKIFAMFLTLLLFVSLFTLPAYADSPDWLNGLKEGAGSLWNTAKDKGSEIIDTVKTEGPGWVETGKEKVGEAVDKAGEVITDTQQKVSDWNASQPEEFWRHTESMINGGATTTPAPANPNSTTTPAPVQPNSSSTTHEATQTAPAPVATTPSHEAGNTSGYQENNASIDDAVEQIRNEILPSAEPEIPENILSAIPIAGDVAALASALPEQNPQNPDDTYSHSEPSELAGTLFYRGEWYRETRGDADVVYDGRAFARTDEVYLNLTTELDDDIIVLDGNVIQLSRTDRSVQEVSPTQPKRRLTDGDMWKSIATATIMVVVICGLGALALIRQSRRRVKDQ